MQTKFEKIYKKFHAHAIIKSAIFGVSLGIITAALWITISKVNAVVSNSLWYILVGVAVAALFGGAAFLLLRPNEQSVAKKLDKAFALGEKTQTMVEYKSKTGLMIEAQRLDAENRLKQIALKDVKTGAVWKHIIAPALAAVMLILAIVTPLQTTDTENQEIGFELSVWQATRLENLIEEVEKSDMDESPKGEVVEKLQGLLSQLANVTTQAKMKTLVIGVIKDVNQIEQKANSANVISQKLLQSSDAEARKLGEGLRQISVDGIKERLTQTRDGLKQAESWEQLIGYKAAVGLALSSVTSLQADSLYAALQAFINGLNGVINDLDGKTDEQVNALVDGVFTAGAAGIEIPLKQQEINLQTTDMVVRELMYIFGISANELPQEERPGYGGSSDGSSKDENTDKGDDGGLGSGNVNYGSNDQIYCPDKGAYVSYGEVLNAYFGRVEEQIRDGNTPETLEQFIREYFDSLY